MAGSTLPDRPPRADLAPMTSGVEQCELDDEQSSTSPSSRSACLEHRSNSPDRERFAT